MYNTLISVAQLYDHLNDPQWAILDCRFSPADFERGRRDYQAAHIPGAVYAYLNEDLSGPIQPGVTGRHPLPSVEAAADQFSQWGIDPGVQVVAYDDAGGALAAARAWWMLRWLGHNAVAVLDGGWQAWLRENRPVRGGQETRPRRDFVPHPRPEMIVGTAEVEALVHDPAYRVFDCRTAERYRGENETIDPVAGHIPGAFSAPYVENLTPEGTFRSPEELRQRYETMLGEVNPGNAIFYCGSGVTAIHDLLAMFYASLGEGRLYVGSWSEWITDPIRPVARGPARG